MSEQEETTQEVEEQEQQETGSTLESVDDYKEALSKARNDAAKYRTRSKEYDKAKAKAEKLDNLIKELTGDGDPDPDKLKSQVNATKQEANRLRMENKVIRLASKYNADDELLFAYLDKKDLLDEDIESNIEQALKDKPSLKLNNAVNTGDSGDKTDAGNKKQFNSWIRGKLS